MYFSLHSVQNSIEHSQCGMKFQRSPMYIKFIHISIHPCGRGYKEMMDYLSRAEGTSMEFVNVFFFVGKINKK
jgi:hypothetical protein